MQYRSGFEAVTAFGRHFRGQTWSIFTDRAVLLSRRVQKVSHVLQIDENLFDVLLILGIGALQFRSVKTPVKRIFMGLVISNLIIKSFNC